MIPRKMVEAFTGRESGLRAKLKGTKYYFYIFFGGIRIPSAIVAKDVNLKDIGRKFECTIAEKSGFYEITPNVVKRIIEEEGFLASHEERHVKALEDWLENRFTDLLREILWI